MGLCDSHSSRWWLMFDTKEFPPHMKRRTSSGFCIRYNKEYIDGCIVTPAEDLQRGFYKITFGKFDADGYGLTRQSSIIPTFFAHYEDVELIIGVIGTLIQTNQPPEMIKNLCGCREKKSQTRLTLHVQTLFFLFVALILQYLLCCMMWD